MARGRAGLDGRRRRRRGCSRLPLSPTLRAALAACPVEVALAVPDVEFEPRLGPRDHEVGALAIRAAGEQQTGGLLHAATRSIVDETARVTERSPVSER